MNNPNCIRGSSIYVSREWSPLRWIYPHDLVESAEADVESRMGDQLDDLGFREVAARLGPEGVVDLVVVEGELLGEPDARPLARTQEIRGLVIDRGDLRFGCPRMPGPGIAHGESVAATVERGDLQPHQLPEHRVDGALTREGGTEGGERLEHGRVPRVGSRARRTAGLALGLLAEMPELVGDLVNAQRLDPRHRRLLSHGRSMISTQFGFFPMGYSFSLVSFPLAGSIA